MQNIHLVSTENTPEINFDFEKGVFEIKGVSYPEYAKEFYEPILSALEKYVNDSTTKQTKMTFKFTYFNTGTNTLITGVLKKMEELSQKEGHEVFLEWYYETDDEDMRELGDYFSSLTSLPINYVACEEI